MRTARILVIDDEPVVRDSLRQVLQFLGHAVEAAPDALTGLALLKKTDFDLVITDYEMPEMKGDKLAATIHAVFPALPVVMLTAYAERFRSATHPPVGVKCILEKPFLIADLRQTIGTLVAARAVAGEGPGLGDPFRKEKMKTMHVP